MTEESHDEPATHGDGELHQALLDYAEIYRRLYGGQKESVTDLIPYMLDAFIQNDRAFAKARRELDGPQAGASSGKKD